MRPKYFHKNNAKPEFSLNSERNNLLEELGSKELKSAESYRDYLKAKGIHQEAERQVNEVRRKWQIFNNIIIKENEQT